MPIVKSYFCTKVEYMSLVDALRQERISRVFRFPLTPANCGRLDLSKSNPDPDFHRIQRADQLMLYIEYKLAAQKRPYAYGGYGERRAIYQRFPLFNRPGTEERDLHLGVDVWCPAGEELLAPLPGVIAGMAYNPAAGDYGGIILLRHQLQGQYFHTLYGHLSRDSLTHSPGARLEPGTAFARLGEVDENGGWPPHLHFQIIIDLEGKGCDYPGVVASRLREHYTANCPDPSLIIPLEVE